METEGNENSGDRERRRRGARKMTLFRNHIRKKGVILKTLVTEQKKEVKRQFINEKYKDSVFRMAFEEKKYQLELYNALNGSDYDDPEAVEVTTLEDTFFIGMRNDLSFVVGLSLNMYEHQSTKNLNMPLRGLIYFAQVYMEYINRNGYRLYAESQIPLPFPKYIVFYNGEKDAPDEEELLLSDAFPEEMKDQIPSLECRARVLNINFGHNKRLMEKCQRLRQYSELVAIVRDYLAKGMDKEEAMRKAWEEGMKRGLLTDILSRNGTEVIAMLFKEYDLEEAKEYWKKEAAEEADAKATSRTLDRDGKLFEFLLSQKRYDDARKAATDSGYRMKLFEMYGI